MWLPQNPAESRFTPTVTNLRARPENRFMQHRGRTALQAPRQALLGKLGFSRRGRVFTQIMKRPGLKAGPPNRGGRNSTYLEPLVLPQLPQMGIVARAIPQNRAFRGLREP